MQGIKGRVVALAELGLWSRLSSALRALFAFTARSRTLLLLFDNLDEVAVSVVD